MLDQPHYDWTDEAIATLKRMWAEGATASEVAAALPGAVSRNAVLGKVHRMKLPKRPKTGGAAQPKPAHGNKGQPKVNAIINSVRAAQPPVPPPEPFDMEDGEGVDVTHLVGIMDLTAHTCRFPIGDPLLPGFGYCGAHTDHGPYCPDHARRSRGQG